MAKSEKKIFLDRLDNLNTAVDKLIQADAGRIILNIPKQSILGDSLHNFQVLKRESNTAGKELFIESVDDHVLELANICGLRAVNPVFKTRERSVSDILPKGSIVRRIADIEAAADTEPVVVEEKREERKRKEPSFIPKMTKPDLPVRKKERASKKSVFRRWAIIAGAAVLMFVLFELATAILPRATIAITLKKTAVNFSDTVQVMSTVKQVQASSSNGIVLPGELLISNCNLTMNFPASGKKQVQTKAAGILFVYNAYSSAPQTLVKNTRFQSPDGKIFRLVSQVTVPGAKVMNGQITPSKISVSVTADQAGVNYNIGPAAGWKIPGFSGTSRYQGFYAESLAPMSGGFVGEQAVASPGDVFNATTSVEQSLAGSCQSKMNIMIASQFKLFDKAKNFDVLQENVQGGTASSGQFSVYAAGEMRELVFDEQMLQGAIENQAAATLSDGVKAQNYNVTYGEPRVDLMNGKMSFSASGTAVFTADFDVQKFKNDILGKDEATLRNLVFTLPGLEKATVSLWPFWVKNVPDAIGRINLTVN